MDGKYFVLFIFVCFPWESLGKRIVKRHGEENHGCDDGKYRISIDLHGDSDYKCYENSPWKADKIGRFDPRCYMTESAYHVCIDKTIDDLYESNIPHSGPHRKVWGQYGEYNYIPPGRYVHNLEHGGVVFMYHPCAPQEGINQLRQLATSCLYRYILTAFPKLTKKYPFAVLTYGCIFRMSKIEPNNIRRWIRGRLGLSPESNVYGNGEYNFGLLVPSIEPTNFEVTNSTFCPDVSTQSLPHEEDVHKSDSDIVKNRKDSNQAGIFRHDESDTRKTESDVDKNYFVDTSDSNQEGIFHHHGSSTLKTDSVFNNNYLEDISPPNPTARNSYAYEDSNFPKMDSNNFKEMPNFHNREGTFPYESGTLEESPGVFESKDMTNPSLINQERIFPHESETISEESSEISPSKEMTNPSFFDQERIFPHEFTTRTTLRMILEEASPTELTTPGTILEEQHEAYEALSTDLPTYEASLPENTQNPTFSHIEVLTAVEAKFQTSLIEDQNKSKNDDTPEVQIVESKNTFFWILASFLCFALGAILGITATRCCQKNRGEITVPVRAWSEKNSADSFSIAAVVRKIPGSFGSSGRHNTDEYRRLEANELSSDDDNNTV
ncbi:uncharacterized protein LOC120342200 [Styela clava]